MIAIILLTVVLAIAGVLTIKTWAEDGYRLNEAEKEAERKFFWRGMIK